MPKRVPKQVYTSQASGRHKRRASDADGIQDSNEAMRDGSERHHESEDQLAATDAAGSSMVQKSSKKARRSESDQGQHQPTTTSSIRSHFTRVTKDLEIQQLKSIIEANKEKIDRVKERARKASQLFETEKDYCLRLEDSLDGALNDVRRMRGELAGKSHLIEDMSHKHTRQSEQLHNMKSQLDGHRIKNVELTKELHETGAKLANLQQSVARLGRNDEQPPDDMIAQRFNNLRSEIMEFVRLLFSSRDDSDTFDDEEEAFDKDDGEELEELRVRQWVAKELFQRFFELDAIFKFLCTTVEQGSGFEQWLRENGCTESLIKARRSAHVKACKATGNFDNALDVFAERQSEAFWKKIQDHAHWIPKGITPEGMVVEKATVSVFQAAARLAIYLQGLPVEYEWEQITRYQDREIRKKDDDIIGTCGPDPDNSSEYQLGFVVFGGVVRGDKTTGLLANGRVRLLKNQVVIEERSSEL